MAKTGDQEEGRGKEGKEERTLSDAFVLEDVERGIVDPFTLEDPDNLLREAASARCVWFGREVSSEPAGESNDRDMRAGRGAANKCMRERRERKGGVGGTDLGVSRSPFMNKTTSDCFINS